LAWVPRSALASDMSQPTGQPLSLLSGNGGGSVLVTRPDGAATEITLDPARPVFFGDTTHAGPYPLVYGEYTEVVAVNLLDRVESSIAPAETLHLGRGEVVAERGRIKQTRELWPWFVMAALAVLSLEWWVYSRRAWM